MLQDRGKTHVLNVGHWLGLGFEAPKVDLGCQTADVIVLHVDQ